jgi:hypothetical protein
MRDIDLFQRAGLMPPWMLAAADLDAEKKRFDVEIDSTLPHLHLKIARAFQLSQYPGDLQPAELGVRRSGPHSQIKPGDPHSPRTRRAHHDTPLRCSPPV